jgi:hypothetical protein
LLSIPLKSPPNLTNLEPRGVKRRVNELKVCSSKWARERGKGGGGFYTPHIEKSCYSSKTRNVRENSKNWEVRRLRLKPEYSGLPRSAPKKITP